MICAKVLKEKTANVSLCVPVLCSQCVLAVHYAAVCGKFGEVEYVCAFFCNLWLASQLYNYARWPLPDLLMSNGIHITQKWILEDGIYWVLFFFLLFAEVTVELVVLEMPKVGQWCTLKLHNTSHHSHRSLCSLRLIQILIIGMLSHLICYFYIGKVPGLSRRPCACRSNYTWQMSFLSTINK